jgi:hypothetical protein
MVNEVWIVLSWLLKLTTLYNIYELSPVWFQFILWQRFLRPLVNCEMCLCFLSLIDYINTLSRKQVNENVLTEHSAEGAHGL